MMTVQQATPFVFQGFHGGSGACNGEPDTTDGPDLDNNNCFYGGGLNSCTFWSEQAGGFVPVPSRWEETDVNWAQKSIRITTVADGEGGVPGPLTTSADIIDAVSEALTESGLYILIESHDMTGTDAAPVGAWDQSTPASGGEDSWENQVRFWDAIIDEFKGNGRVWFNFYNEPVTQLNAPQVWQDQATFWLRRAREHHGANNICVFDLGEWGQDLKGLADGAYDDWVADVTTLGIYSNVVFGWHAYGARQGTAYTYATMDQDLATVHAKGYPVLVGEYGQAAAVGTGNAGPDQWNRNAVEYLVTADHGEPLAKKYELLMYIWILTGDGGFWHTYKLTQGDDPDNPDGVLDPGVNGWSIPFWDIASEGDIDQYGEPLGQHHWHLSHGTGDFA